MIKCAHQVFLLYIIKSNLNDGLQKLLTCGACLDAELLNYRQGLKEMPELELGPRTKKPKRAKHLSRATQNLSVACRFSDRMDVLHKKLTVCTICTFILLTGREFKQILKLMI